MEIVSKSINDELISVFVACLSPDQTLYKLGNARDTNPIHYIYTTARCPSIHITLI